MFETNEKKDLKNKYNKMSMIADGKFKKQSAGMMQGNKQTVYGELKLSE